MNYLLSASPHHVRPAVGEHPHVHMLEESEGSVGFVASVSPKAQGVLTYALLAAQRMAPLRAAPGIQAIGSGVLVSIPTPFFKTELELLGVPSVVHPGELGIAVLFIDRAAGANEAAVQDVRRLVEVEVASAGLRFLAWRPVPVNERVLDPAARDACPHIVHVIVGPGHDTDRRTFEPSLMRLRDHLEQAAKRAGIGVHVPSCSSRTVVYKGLVAANRLARFYPDLTRPEFCVELALFHVRHANTPCAWDHLQPHRHLAHMGEVITLQGNLNGLNEGLIDRPATAAAYLDQVAERLTRPGRSMAHAVLMLQPEAWESADDLPKPLRAFYRYHSTLLAPWEGPAATVFTDGQMVGVLVDRNGLRPLRYTLTTDGYVVAAPEAGLVPIAPERVRRHGAVGPGHMLAVDVKQGRIYENPELKLQLAAQAPYAEWAGARLISPDAGPITNGPAGQASAATYVEAAAPAGAVPGPLAPTELTRLQQAFGYQVEELALIIRPMVETSKEPVGSMGDDTPAAVLSHKRRPLYHFFKQRFAKVSHPPIDHLRERMACSLRTLLGCRPNPFANAPNPKRVIELDSPVLLDQDLARIRQLGERVADVRPVTLSTCFPVAAGPEGLEAALDRLTEQAIEAVDSGAHILILSDRGVNAAHAHIPALLAAGAVHHALIRNGKRAQASLVIESGEPREIHHIATLLGYGAAAVNPYLALASARAEVNEGRLRKLGLTPETAERHFKKAVEDGLLKVMAKMGITTAAGYCGAQTFEAVGLRPRVIDRCFTGTPSIVAGDDFVDLAADVLAWHADAFQTDARQLPNLGYYKPKPKRDGEFHVFTPETAKALHRAVRLGAGILDGDWTDSYAAYQRWVALVHSRPGQLRDLLAVVSDRPPIRLEEVEPVEAIVRRFSTGHMSLGSLSPEAHATLAIAMNRLGARSGSGEGGEDATRFGTEENSAIKQVASARFGVTPAYLASAQELQIKLAQGSKPGEGGQIPGHKVTDLIARLRHTVPGVALISPPLLHDVHSLADLQQLIADLRQTNPLADISVKLVAETGVGSAACAVAQGGADILLISGDAGGTGSSPLNSIKNAGLPWELGLAEAQRALVAAGLRSRVAVRVDGGMKTGRDVLLAALLGADEYSFGTAAMISEGCVMARVCHTNNCPVGVASQRPDLRAQFPGKPENVMAYFLFVAQEVREMLAQLGYRTLGELVGRTDLLRQQHAAAVDASNRVDLTPLLQRPAVSAIATRRDVRPSAKSSDAYRLNQRLVEEARPAYELGRHVQLAHTIAVTDRSVGTALAYEIARRYGDAGLPSGSVQVELTGCAGRSFGAFNIAGVSLRLTGEANDFVGKGMAGGEIVLRPNPQGRLTSHENVICGNAVLYGATGGELYAAGQAGMRFAVRNSGAVAVVEGVGDHGCEYMTGGAVVVLGPVGRNFGAGMTGGEAFIFAEDETWLTHLNTQLVRAERLVAADGHRLRDLVARHAKRTGSLRAHQLLADWDHWVFRFWRVAPLSEVGSLAAVEEGVVAR